MLLSSIELSCVLQDIVFNIWMEGEALQDKINPEVNPELWEILDKINWCLFDAWMRFHNVRGSLTSPLIELEEVLLDELQVKGTRYLWNLNRELKESTAMTIVIKQNRRA